MEFAWGDLWTAVALMLIIEGILPFLNPSSFRQMLQMMSQMKESNIRILGACWMAAGLIVLYLARG